MKRNMRLLGVMVLLGISVSVAAQTENTAQESFDDFRKKAEAEFNSFSQRSSAEYQAFRDSVNKAYADFLEQAWAEFKKGPAIPKPKDREFKPTPMPKGGWNKPFESKPIRIEEVVAPVIPSPQPMPISPIPHVEEPKETWANLTLYGTPMKVRFSEEQRFSLNGLSEASVANAWRILSGEQYNNTIRDCLALRLKHQLCDWAYLQLVEQIGKVCCGEGNEATLLTAYLYAQSGYRMRLAMSGSRLYMLFASDYSLYDKGSFLMDGIHFYVMGAEEPNRLNICKAEFPKEQPLALALRQEQLLTNAPSDIRTLSSKNHPEVKCDVQVNRNLVDFYNDYPSSMYQEDFMTRWAIYANTPMQTEVRNKMYPTLRKLIDGKTQREAVRVLLDFVQWAFVYEYDNKVWGHDRAFFSEETLFYPYADCEDRSILFSRLVRDLMGLKVALVYYPGHLATAVHFTDDVQGDYLTLQNQRFVICDPTYFGANVGQTMTDMDNSTAKAILLE